MDGWSTPRHAVTHRSHWTGMIDSSLWVVMTDEDVAAIVISKKMVVLKERLRFFSDVRDETLFPMSADEVRMILAILTAIEGEDE